jgi:hypothetical protein
MSPRFLPWRWALALLAIAPSPSPAPAGGAGGGTPPSARIEAVRYEGTVGPTWLLRCRSAGLTPPLKHAWTLSPGLRTAVWAMPLDEDAVLVNTPEPIARGTGAECKVSDAHKREAHAQIALDPIAVTAATVAAGGPLTVEGSGFGGKRGNEDGVWLVPPRGFAVAADHACKQASWSETRITACVPSPLPRALQVRVQSRGRLGLGPALTGK